MDNQEKKVDKLYKSNRTFRKLYNLFFDEFGWDVFVIDGDILKIWKIVKPKGKK